MHYDSAAALSVLPQNPLNSSLFFLQTRWVNALSFFINTQIAGLAPVFLRVANVLLHTLNTVLVCVLLKNVFSIDVEQTKGRQGGVVYLLAFMGGLFFAVNPVAVIPCSKTRAVS